MPVVPALRRPPTLLLLAPLLRIGTAPRASVRPSATDQFWLPVRIVTVLESVRFCVADAMSMPPVPSDRPLPEIEIAPAGSTTRSPRMVVAAVLPIVRFCVDDASKTAVPVDVGTAAFQFEAVCQVASVAPVQVWATADWWATASKAPTASIGHEIREK